MTGASAGAFRLLAAIRRVCVPIFFFSVAATGFVTAPPARADGGGTAAPVLVARPQGHATLQQVPAGTASVGGMPSAADATRLRRHVRDAAALARAKTNPSRTSGVRVVAGPRAPAAPAAPPLLSGFAGATRAGDIAAFPGSQDVAPPDDTLAVSSTAVAEAVNSSLWVTDRAGNAKRSFALSTLFMQSNVGDARILYDVNTNSWFMSVLTVQSGGSVVYIAVAANQADPTAWMVTPVQTTPGVVQDQPKLGYSDDKVIVAFSDFDLADQFVGQETWALQKSDLIAGAPGVAATSLFGRDTSRFALAPAQSLSSTSDAFVVYNNGDPNNASQNRSGPTLGVLKVVGTPRNNSLTVYEADPQVAAFSAPPSATQANGTFLDTGDDRLLGAAWLNGLLWTTANVACLDGAFIRACSRFIEAVVTGGGAAAIPGQVWDLGAAGTDYYYAAATFTGAGDMIASVSESRFLGSPATDPSVDAVGQGHGYAGGPSFVSRVQTGARSYQDGSGAVPCRSNASVPCGRWGDYGGAANDPSDAHGAWVVGEYVPAAASTDPADWGTWIENVSAAAVPAPGGGYTLDGYGGVHPMGDSPSVDTSDSWPGWDIARTLAINPCDPSRHSGWVMDGFGGLHPFGGAPAVTGTAYWPGWAIANDFVALPCTAGGHATGYVLDGFGGLHSWYQTASDPPPAPTVTGYWPGWDIAIRLSAVPGTSAGYVMDGFGGLHPFNNATFYPATGYWPGWMIARDVVAVSNGAGSIGGYTVDGFGGIHQFGSVPSLSGTGYWPGWDIARAIGSPDAAGIGHGYTLDGLGGVHPIAGSPFVTVSEYGNGAPFRDVVTAP